MKFPRIVVSIGVIGAALIATASVRADLMPVRSAPSPHLQLAASQSASDIQIAIPRVGGTCAAHSLPRMKAAAAVNPSSKKLSSAKPDAAGPIVPAVGPDGLTWLCREDEEAQQCVCIPFVQ
jgi:hypothetical protein